MSDKTSLNITGQPPVLETAEFVFELPAPEHRGRANAFKESFFAAGETVINGSALLDQLEYDQWLVNTIRNRHDATARQDWVTSTTFFAVDKRSGIILGIIDIRHSLEQEFLKEYGGHIGYAVRPEERRKGIATRMLRLALQYCRFLGLKRVMLGCYADNIASIRTIIRCGGCRTETKPYRDGKPMNVYWIDLT